MKTSKIILSLCAATLSLWIVGCKQETKPVAEQTPDTTAPLTEAVTKTVESAKETSTKVIQDTTDSVKEAVAPVSSKAEELIAAARSLMAEGKFKDALAKIKETSGEKLSASQQTIVDDLKAQIEKALAVSSKAASDASNAVGNLLNK